MESILSVLLGLVCIGIGISNRRGNISTLHSYHRKRVAEEDRVPFGKLVGLGMILVGVALMLMGGLSLLATARQEPVYQTVGTILLVLGLAAGLGICFYAMKKYNKGIF